MLYFFQIYLFRNFFKCKLTKKLLATLAVPVQFVTHERSENIAEFVFHLDPTNTRIT